MTGAPLGLPLSKIAEQSGLSKSSTYRLLQTLVRSGYLLQKQASGHYFPSLKVLSLSRKLIEDTDLRAVSRPHLVKLAHSTGETAHLVLLDRDAMVYVDKVESPNPIRRYSRIGRRALPHCTGVGKAILAYLPPDRFESVLEANSLERHTEKTIVDLKELQAHLAEIRERGYAVDDGEHEADVRCLAAPLFATSGAVAGAIGIDAVSYRVGMPALLSWRPMLERHAKQLSSELTHYFDRYT